MQSVIVQFLVDEPEYEKAKEMVERGLSIINTKYIDWQILEPDPN